MTPMDTCRDTCFFRQTLLAGMAERHVRSILPSAAAEILDLLQSSLDRLRHQLASDSQSARTRRDIAPLREVYVVAGVTLETSPELRK